MSVFLPFLPAHFRFTPQSTISTGIAPLPLAQLAILLQSIKLGLDVWFVNNLYHIDAPSRSVIPPNVQCNIQLLFDLVYVVFPCGEPVGQIIRALHNLVHPSLAALLAESKRIM